MKIAIIIILALVFLIAVVVVVGAMLPREHIARRCAHFLTSPSVLWTVIKWIVYPKGVKSITEAEVMKAGKAAGLVDTKVASFSSTHTALKMVIPVSKRTLP